MQILIADIETDSLKPSTIHMVGLLDYHTDEFFDYHGEELVDGLLRMAEADILILYNGIGYDIPVIEKLTNGLIKFNRKRIIEVLNLSRKLVQLENHKLKTWGNMFENYKGDHKDFSKYSVEMSEYCAQDCRLTKQTFDFLNELGIDKGHGNVLQKFIEDQLTNHN